MSVGQGSSGSKGPLKSILIVDDDPMVVKAMGALLSQAGFRAIVTQNGEEAFRRLDGDVVAAIVDIHLPDINGLQLTQRLRDHMTAGAPIIILSGDNSIETLRALPDSGATFFFSKPVNAGALIEFIREKIKGQTAAID